MSILDIFNFKSKLQEVVTKENLDAFIGIAREKIIEQAKKKTLDGVQKMDSVVDDVVEWIEENINSDNKIVQWLIDKILIPNVRNVCQKIYELLKEAIKGL